MGHVYSQAREVHVWLGKDKRMVEAVLVFALVGLANDVPPGFVDYKNDVRQTYIRCAGKFALHAQSLDFLTVAAADRPRSSGRPLRSWCLDWSCTSYCSYRALIW